MAVASSRHFSPGDVVSGEYSEGQWYLATVEQELGDGNYLLSWLDGDTSNRLKHRSEMRLMRFNRATQSYEEDTSARGPPPAAGKEPAPGSRAAGDRGAPAPAASGRTGSAEEHSIGQSGGELAVHRVDAPEQDAAEAAEEEEPHLEIGDRVELVNLHTRPELSGLTGTIVDLKDGRWRVNVDDVGNRLLHAKNLRVIPAGDEVPLEMEEQEEEGREGAEGEVVDGEEGEPFPPDGLVPGVIVRIQGLRKQTELNGLFATLLERREERWLLQVEGQEEPTELSPEDVVRVEAEDDVYEQPWERDFEPPPCYMFGSWDGWAGGHMMDWDPARSCLQYILELGSEAQESFRILIDGDLDQQLHPDCMDADYHTGFQVLGPGKNDDGLNWAVGRHPLDEAVAGAKYEVRLFIGRAGFYKIDWELLGKYKFGSRTKPLATKTPASAVPRMPALMPNRATLKILVQAARPTWSAATLDSVLDKLSRVGIESGLALIDALQNTEHGDLNFRLKAAGEKNFTADTLEALRERANAWETEIRMRENAPMKELDISVFRLDDRPSDGMAMLDPESLPVQTFRVVSWRTVFVRERPCANSPAIGKKEPRDEVRAKEQSFDGYVKLLGEPGWILRDTGDEQGLGRVLEVVGEPLPLLIEELAERSGPQKFVVTRQGRGVIRVAPDDAAAAIAFKHANEAVYIDTQTYNGWLRVSADEASNGGWMQPNDPEDGQLLRCNVLEERQERKRNLRQAREVLEGMEGPSPDTAKLRSALALAKDAGMDREELRAAEAAFEQVLKREAREQERQRLEQAREEVRGLLAPGARAPDAKALQTAIARAKAAGMSKEELAAADERLQSTKKEEEAERKQQAKRKHLQHRIQTSAGNVRLLRGCIHDGEAAGLMEEVALAESMLEKAVEQEKEAARNALRQRIEAAAGKEKELSACRAEAEAAGFQDVVEMAEKAIRNAAEESKSTAATHEVLLKAVTDSAASNNKDEIKRAREAAKKAGISIKLIAKAYALGQNAEN